MFVTGTIKHMVDRKLYRPRVTIEGKRVGLNNLTTAGGEILYFDSLQRTELTLWLNSHANSNWICGYTKIPTQSSTCSEGTTTDQLYKQHIIAYKFVRNQVNDGICRYLSKKKQQETRNSGTSYHEWEEYRSMGVTTDEYQALLALDLNLADGSESTL
tara:strand:+ start:320 stop:793 length:474 start_codon:yes stop_codon:yes gene_type:complete